MPEFQTIGAMIGTALIVWGLLYLGNGYKL